MKRIAWCMGVSIALAALSSARADYLVIKVNLNKLDELLNPAGGGGGAPGMMPGGPGGPGLGAGGPGLGAGGPGLGAGGPGLGAGGPGLGSGGPGFGGGAGARGGMGFGGGQGPGGFGGGKGPGGAGFGGGPGLAGGGGAGARGGMGFGGGPPGGAGPGGMMPGMMPGGDQQQTQVSAEDDPDAHWVTGIVEIRGKMKPADPPQNTVIYLDHRWGKKAAVPSKLPVFSISYIKHDSQTKVFTKEFKPNAKDQSSVALVQAASSALRHGLAKPFEDAMADLIKQDPKHPAAVNYQKVKAELEKPLAQDDPAHAAILRELKADNYQQFVSEKGHYAIWTNVEGNSPMIKRRLARLEETMANFYYWFALQSGVEVPAFPKYRLVCVVMDQNAQFHNRHVAWGSPMHSHSGFTPRRENVIFMSKNSMNEDHQLLSKNLSTFVSAHKYSRDELVTGKIWDRQKQIYQQAMYVAVGQTMGLVETAVEDSSERATITHEGTRQLLVASSMFPRNVEVPEWVLTGLGAFFETSEHALYPGFGTASWTHLIEFKHHRKIGSYAKPAEVLMDVVTDAYVRQAADLAEDFRKKRDDEVLKKKARTKWELAQCTPWSLVFYLAQHGKVNHLARYGQELHQLPRDWSLDERAMRIAFARAFDLTDAKSPNDVDQGRFRSFAETWLNAVNNWSLEVGLVENQWLKDRASRDQPPRPRPAPTAGFGVPGSAGPGGFGPPGLLPGGGLNTGP